MCKLPCQEAVCPLTLLVLLFPRFTILPYIFLDVEVLSPGNSISNSVPANSNNSDSDFVNNPPRQVDPIQTSGLVMKETEPGSWAGIFPLPLSPSLSVVDSL